MIKGTLLIVDDNRPDQDSLKKVLSGEVEKIITIAGPDRIIEVLSRNEIDIVLLEMNFNAKIKSGNEGLFWMREILNYDKNIIVILITSFGNIELAVRAIREGAFDFILKPWNPSKLIATIYAAWKLRQLQLEAADLKDDNRLLKKEINKGMEKIVLGASPTMINVMNIVRKVHIRNRFLKGVL